MDKEMIKIIGKIQNGQFQKVEPNQIFFDYYATLREHIETTNIPKDDLYLIQNQARIFAIDEELRMSENVIVIFNPATTNIKFLPHENGIELYRFEIFNENKEIRKFLLKMFVNVAKQLNIKIYFNPNHPNFGEIEDEKWIKKLYRKFNFKKIPGCIYWRN